MRPIRVTGQCRMNILQLTLRVKMRMKAHGILELDRVKTLVSVMLMAR